ncbi:MAG: hypothetical protein U1F76_17785 [Candidatus Competibacteraceae bacterium]
MPRNKLISVCILYFFSSRVGAVESLCSAAEAVIFSCPTRQKIVSVCASKDLSATTGYMQYRFGPKGAPEIVYPQSKEHPRNYTESGVLTFAGGGGAYLRFKKEQYGYVVYTAIGRGWGQKAGLVVEKNNKLLSNFRCNRETATSELGPDFFEKAGLPKDQEGFDLP